MNSPAQSDPATTTATEQTHQVETATSSLADSTSQPTPESDVQRSETSQAQASPGAETSNENILPEGLLLLLEPSSNRVYAGDAARLNAAEITVMAAGLGLPVTCQPVTVCGVDYLHLARPTDARNATTQNNDLARVASEASGAWALFNSHGGVMRPMPLSRIQPYPGDLVTIQKYQGKTNEQFTRLLMNVTAALSAKPERLLDRTLTYLDPMCGRGTTLNSALLRGFDVVGAEIDKADFDQYQAFLTTWLRNHRLKHTIDTMQVRRSGTVHGRQLDVEVATSKAEWKAGRTQQLTYLNVDTTRLDQVVRKTSVDVIVADTPYGVQHGSHGDSVRRSPLDLLSRALPAWYRTLRTGGTLGLAYNRHVASPEALAELLQEQGFDVVHGAGNPAPGLDADAFRHRVDASIDRDIVVARKN